MPDFEVAPLRHAWVWLAAEDFPGGDWLPQEKTPAKFFVQIYDRQLQQTREISSNGLDGVWIGGPGLELRVHLKIILFSKYIRILETPWALWFLVNISIGISIWLNLFRLNGKPNCESEVGVSDRTRNMAPTWLPRRDTRGVAPPPSNVSLWQNSGIGKSLSHLFSFISVLASFLKRFLLNPGDQLGSEP